MTSLVESGDKLLVVHRRLFEKDDNRFFVGEVEGFDAGVVRVRGFTFVRDLLGGAIRRKIESRTKLLSVTSGTLLFYVLPPEVEPDAVEFVAEEAELHLAGPNGFRMNLSEWTHRP